MAKIKLTKTELKSQRDSLKRFKRFLPTLQLKKQQLQMEMRKCQAKLRENEERERDLRSNLDVWVALFGDDSGCKRLQEIVTLVGIETDIHNIAGVKVPVFIRAEFNIDVYELFSEEPWIDDAVRVIQDIIAIREEHNVIEEQYRLIGNELRVTTQRVNLFEKVKIPECRENIRVIQIYLGDMDTAAVGRAKIAKRKIQGTAA